VSYVIRFFVSSPQPAATTTPSTHHHVMHSNTNEHGVPCRRDCRSSSIRETTNKRPATTTEALQDEAKAASTIVRHESVCVADDSFTVVFPATLRVLASRQKSLRHFRL